MQFTERLSAGCLAIVIATAVSAAPAAADKPDPHHPNHGHHQPKHPNHGHDPRGNAHAIGRIVRQILRSEPGTTRAEINATITLIAKQAGVPRVKAARALEADLAADARAVRADAEAAGRMDPQRTSSSGDGGRIRVPAAKHNGDIVYAPNVSKHWNHGHAAIFRTHTSFVHAPGNGQLVQEVDHSAVTAKSFARGAQLMMVRTRKGRGPILSIAKRDRAGGWAASRIGDEYRSVVSPNTKVVSGPVGSSGSKQNCSQLVWAAYKVANDYDFNPVSALEWGLPAVAATDKDFVWPKELVDAPQTVVYAKITRDGQY